MASACGSCQKGAAPLQCSGCKEARYCGQDCYKAAWKDHKPLCLALRAIEAERGFAKKILETGTEVESKPPTGSTVHVTYIGKFANGNVFDSSTDEDKPFSFTLGVGEVIQGWDKGMATLAKGERYVFPVRDTSTNPLPTHFFFCL
jgi:FKBP-type peptidyl-prolyl cis-trans isomerase/MYND finger